MRPRSRAFTVAVRAAGLSALAAAVMAHASSAPFSQGAAASAPAARPAGWSDATHGRQVKPDYTRLFSTDRVHELRITIPAATFKEMQDDLATLGPGGMMGRGGSFPRPGAQRMGFPPGVDIEALMQTATKACAGKAAAASCNANGIEGQCTAMGGLGLMCVPAGVGAFGGRGGPMNPMMGGPLTLISRDPKYVPVTVVHDGRTWTSVGMRYKGNSSLLSSMISGNGKIPFRLDFSKYEKDVPAIANQRFYGFNELTFSSNFSDDTQLRELLAAEVLRDRGVPAARVAFYRVTVDSGDGPRYWGLYTMVEDPSDGAMLDVQFGSREGNLYKPDGPGADWTTFNAAGFEKKNNTQQADFSDVNAAIEALHAPRDNAETWRRNLEARFNVDGFLRWLAVNAVIENWDSYGVFAHNYYLYAAPGRSSQLQWIPWDHNLSFGLTPMMTAFALGRGPAGAPASGGPGGFRGPAMGMMFGGGPTGTDVLAEKVGARWPLISFLIADDVYRARYRVLLNEAMGGLLAPAAFEARVRQLHKLISSSVIGPRGERPTHTTISSAAAFERSLDGPDGLIQHLMKRAADVRAALGSDPGVRPRTPGV